MKTDKKRDIKEKAKKRVKKWILTLILSSSGIWLLLPLLIGVVIAITALLSMVSTVNLLLNEEKVEEPCKCVLYIDKQVYFGGSSGGDANAGNGTGDVGNGYGYSTGNLDPNASLVEQALNILHVTLNHYDASVPEWVIWGNMSIESNTTCIKDLYPNGTTSIFTSALPQHAAGSNNKKTESYNFANGAKKPATSKGVIYGKFQIMTPGDPWAVYVPDEWVKEAGGVVDKSWVRSEGKGHMNYLPDVMYGISKNFVARRKVADKYFTSAVGEEYTKADTLTKDYCTFMVHCWSYLTPNALDSNVGNKPAFLKAMFYICKAFATKPEAFSGMKDKLWGYNYDNNVRDVYKKACEVLGLKYQYFEVPHYGRNTYGGYSTGGLLKGIYNFEKDTGRKAKDYLNGGGNYSVKATASAGTTGGAITDYSSTVMIGDSLTVGMVGHISGTELSSLKYVAQVSGQIQSTRFALGMTGGKQITSHPIVRNPSTFTTVDSMKKVGIQNLIMALGTNYMTSMNDYKTLVSEVQNGLGISAGNVYLVNIKPCNDGNNATYQSRNKEIEKMCSEKGWHLIDMWSTFYDSSAPGNIKVSDLGPGDKIHCSADGYKKMINKIIADIKSGSSSAGGSTGSTAGSTASSSGGTSGASSGGTSGGTNVTSAGIPESYLIKGNIPTVNQNSIGLPTGCESCATVLALKYSGIDIDYADFVDNYLEKGTKGVDSPYSKFIGSPKNDTGFGCFPPVIVKAANKVINSKGKTGYTVKDLTGTSLKDLYKYIANDIPVIVWSCNYTMNNGAHKVSSYNYSNTTGATETWPAPEHCMLLVGYTKDCVKISDPLKGQVVEYSLSKANGGKYDFESDYNNYLGKKAVAIIPSGKTAPTGGTNVAAAGGSGKTVNQGMTGTQGKYSGIWKDLEELVNTKGDATSKKLAPYVGHAPQNMEGTVLENDNFKEINGYGTVIYSQGQLSYQKPYSSKQPSADFLNYGCGTCATAMVASTMTGLRVTPAEVAIAANTYDGGAAWSQAIILPSGIKNLLTKAGFTCELGGNTFTKEKVDKVLDDNGMVIYVARAGKSVWGSAGNHYVVIRNRVGDKYYVVDSGCRPSSSVSVNRWKAKDWDTVYKSQCTDGGSHAPVYIISAPSDLSSASGSSLSGDSSDTSGGAISASNASGAIGYRIYKCKNCTCEGAYCTCHSEGSIHKENGLKVYIKADGGGLNNIGDISSSSTSGENTSGDENGDGGVSSGPASIPQGTWTKTPGQFQGVWGGKSTEEIYNEAPVNGGRNVTSSYFNTLKSVAGTYSGNYGVKYKPWDVPNYSQFRGKTEPWTGKANLGYNNSADSLFSVGCHIYMNAHICSVLQGKVINPPEMLILCHHYGIVNSSGSMVGSQASMNSLYNTMGYSVKAYTSTQVNDSVKAELDAALKAGIPCGFRAKANSKFASSQGHYLNIDYVTDDGLYGIAQSAKGASDNKASTWAEIKNNLYGQGRICLWIIYK